MTGMRCLVACVGLAVLTPGAAMAQVRSTLDAQFPSDHEYVVAVWFQKKDKVGTFQFSIMDPSIPGNYDRRIWEDAKLKWNDPNGAGMMRIFPIRTTQNSRQTERQQVMARVEQERQRIEFQDPGFVDVKPEPKEKAEEKPKKDEGKTTFQYDEKAKKSADVGRIAGRWKWSTEWNHENQVYTCMFTNDGKFYFIGAANNEIYTFKIEVNSVIITSQEKERQYPNAKGLINGKAPYYKGIISEDGTSINGVRYAHGGNVNDGEYFEWTEMVLKKEK